MELYTFVGGQLHPSPGGVEGYPSPEEPPTSEASEDILYREMLMLTTRLVVLSVCRD